MILYVGRIREKHGDSEVVWEAIARLHWNLTQGGYSSVYCMQFVSYIIAFLVCRREVNFFTVVGERSESFTTYEKAVDSLCTGLLPIFSQKLTFICYVVIIVHVPKHYLFCRENVELLLKSVSRRS